MIFVIRIHSFETTSLCRTICRTLSDDLSNHLARFSRLEMIPIVEHRLFYFILLCRRFFFNKIDRVSRLYLFIMIRIITIGYSIEFYSRR